MPDEKRGEPKRKRLSLPRQATDGGIVAELLVLLETVTADGRITDPEVADLKGWLHENEATDLPGIEYLRTTVAHVLTDGKVTAEERNEVYKAVERVLPVEARRAAKERRTAIEALEKARLRAEKDAERAREREARVLASPVAGANFMVAGVLHEDRAEVIEQHAAEGAVVFLVRDQANIHDTNAIQVRLRNGEHIGFVPRDEAARLAPFLDSGCTHRAHITKILDGRRALIPVVDAEVYRAGAQIAGAVSQTEVPSETRPASKPASLEIGCGCLITALVATAALGLLMLSAGCQDPAG